MKRTLQAAALAVALVAGSAMAHDAVAGIPGPMNPELNLDAQSRVQVDNDLMTVTMTVEAEGTRVQELSQKALAVMQKATARAKDKGGIEVRVGSVNTFPVWGPKGKTDRWQVRGDVTLVSTNVSALGLLASELTSDMQISSVNFGLSRAKRDEVEAKLIAEVAAAFKHKAQATTQALGFKSYTIKMVGLSQEGSAPPPGPRPMMMAMKAGMAEAAAVPIPSEGGKTEVVLTMNGSVELR